MALIVAAAAILRIWMAPIYSGGEDSIYISSAVELSRGDYWPNSHWQARIGIVGPLALLIGIFGYSVEYARVIPLVASLGCVLLAYWVARIYLKDSRTAVLAALLVAVFPLDNLFARTYFVAMPLAAFSGLALGFYGVALKRENVAFAVIAGMCLGVAYTTRVTALYLLLPLLIDVIVKRSITRFHLGVGAGLLAIIAAEIGVFAAIFEDPLVRIKILAGIGEFGGTSTHFSGGADLQQLMTKRDHLRIGGLFGAPLVSLFTNQEYGFFYFLFIPAAWFAIRSDNQGVRVIAIVFACLALYTLWGTTSPTTYKTLRPWPRYMSAATIPGCIVLAWWLTNRCSLNVRRFLVVGLIVSSVLCIYIDSTRTKLGALQEIIALSHDHAPVALSARSYRGVAIINDLDMRKFGLLVKESKVARTDPFKLVAQPQQFERDSLAGVFVVQLANSKAKLPANCRPVDSIMRQPRAFSELLRGSNELLDRLANKLDPLDKRVVYRCD